MGRGGDSRELIDQCVGGVRAGVNAGPCRDVTNHHRELKAPPEQVQRKVLGYQSFPPRDSLDHIRGVEDQAGGEIFDR